MRWRNITSKDLDKGVAQKLKLVAAESKRSRERKFWYVLDGEKQFSVTLPNIHGGSSSVSPGYIQSVKRSLRLPDNDEFVDLVSCKKSAEDYEIYIRERLGLW